MGKENKDKHGNVLKVVELGIEDQVYAEMKKPKFSVEALARRLNSEGVSITSQSLRKFIKKTKTAQQELISKDLQTAEQVKQLTMDYGKALKDILQEVEEVKNMAKEEKDMTTYNQLVGRIMQGIELVAKLTGDMKASGSVDINIIYNEITTNIEKKLSYMKNKIYKDTTISIEEDIENDDKKEEEKLTITVEEDE